MLFYSRPRRAGGAILTAFTNRIGDILLFTLLATLINDHTILPLPREGSSLIFFPALLVAAGITKSAIFPFSAWLPAAMAAPTPVSALVHSSTLVTGGVFLLIRAYPLYSDVPTCLTFFFFLGALTGALAGWAAIFETDLKIIIAYSTISQVGLIACAIGLGQPILAYYHLLTHALFKSLLFLAAGVLFSFHGHNQDLRAFGQLLPSFPLASTCVVVSLLALTGFPFLSGFYSKDLIVEYVITGPIDLTCYLLFWFALLFTSVYSLRLLRFLTLTPRHSQPLSPRPNESPYAAPLFSLLLASIIGGATLSGCLPIPIPSLPICALAKIFLWLTITCGAIVGWNINTATCPTLSPYAVRLLGLSSLSTSGACNLFFPLRRQTLKLADTG